MKIPPMFVCVVLRETARRGFNYDVGGNIPVLRLARLPLAADVRPPRAVVVPGTARTGSASDVD